MLFTSCYNSNVLGLPQFAVSCFNTLNIVTKISEGIASRETIRSVVPNQGGILSVQGRNFHFRVKLPIHCKCCVSFQNWHWLFQLAIFLYVCKLFSGLSHVFFYKLQCPYLTSNSFVSLQVIVVNKDDCSSCS